MRTKSTNNTLIFLVVLLLLVVGGLGYYTYDFHNKVQAKEYQLASEKARFTEQLEEEMTKYSALLAEKNTAVNDLKLAQERLSELQKVVDEDMMTRSSVQRYQMELRRLRKEREFYVKRGDSLETETQRLTQLQRETQEALERATRNQDSIQDKNNRLTEQLLEGSKVTLSSLIARGVIQRNSGQFANTARASRAEMIQVCFAINENTLAQPGNKSFYVQVVSESGSLVGVERSETLADGTKLTYNAKTTIPYKNKVYSVCELVLPIQQLQAGDYTVRVFHKSAMLLSTELSLK